MTAIIATLVRHAPLSWTFTRSRSLLLLLLLLLLNSACRCAALDERYEFQVNEESEVGTPVGVVTLKTGLKYKFVVGNAGGNGAGGGSSDDPLFSLDDNSGEITVQGRLDRESLGDIVEFVLTSYPSSRHVVEVLVHIVDINDNAPKFPYTGARYFHSTNAELRNTMT